VSGIYCTDEGEDRGETMRRPDVIRITVALIAALGLHALLLHGVGFPKRQTGVAQPLQVHLVPHESPPRAHPLQAVKPVVKRSASVPAPHAAVTATATEREPSHAAPQVVSAKEEGEAAKRRGGKARLSLVLKQPDASVPDAGAASRQNALALHPGGEDRAMETSVVRDRLHDWVAGAQAQRRMEFPDVYWREAARVLGDAFRPGPDLFEHTANADRGGMVRDADPPASGSKGARASMNDEIVSLPNEARGLESVSLSGAPQFNVSLASIVGLFAAGAQQRLVALVRVRQQRDGSVSTVELVTGSGNAAYDRLALASARKLDTVRSGAPRGNCETLWRFETEFVNVLTRKNVRSRVQLAAID
jgi:hypothetical protein